MYKLENFSDGRWSKLPFMEQMANIGSEVERALNWQAKHNTDYTQKAYERALELVDLTLDCAMSFARLKELARVREAIVDYFSGTNQFMSTESSWRRYFSSFTYAVRGNC